MPPVPVHPELCTAPEAWVVIVFGPPLAGRSALARALEHRLPGARRFRAASGRFPASRLKEALALGVLPIVEGDFRAADDRRAARRACEALGARALFVAWLCDGAEAAREIYHRYARVPERYADHWWRLWEADLEARQPLGVEIPTADLVGAGARGSLLDHAVRVAAALGLPGVRPAGRLAARRVLVVDDDDETRVVLAETLEALGCEVFSAASADEALAIVEEEPLDLVLTDQQMPGRSGTELAAELAMRRPDVHVALLTGYAEQTVDAALATRGIELVLAKPAAAADLVRLLEELTDRPE